MRLATYNIRNGGQGDGDSVGRLDEIIRVIQHISPDVLAIQEANGFGAHRRKTLRRMESATGMRGYLCPTSSGFDVALLVRPPLRVVRFGIARANFTHGALYVDVADGEKPPLRIVATHLSPLDGDQRLWEVRRLLRRTAVGGRVVLMGDFNSLDSQAEIANVRRLQPSDRARYLLPGTLDTIDTRVMDQIGEASLVDLGKLSGPAGCEPTVPTKHGGGSEFHRMRLDRIFGSPEVARRVFNGRVERTPPADSASDHYPLVIDLTI